MSTPEVKVCLESLLYNPACYEIPYTIKVTEEIEGGVSSRTYKVYYTEDDAAWVTTVKVQACSDHIKITSFSASDLSKNDGYYFGVDLAISDSIRRGFEGWVTAELSEIRPIHKLVNGIALFAFTDEADRKRFRKLRREGKNEADSSFTLKINEKWEKKSIITEELWNQITDAQNKIAHEPPPDVSGKVSNGIAPEEIKGVETGQEDPPENRNPDHNDDDDWFRDALAYVFCFLWIADLIDVVNGWFTPAERRSQ